MAEDTSARFPVRNYSYATKPEGIRIFVNLEWTVESLSGLEIYKFYKFRPQFITECDLEMSFRKEEYFVRLYVENKEERYINLSATTTASDKDGKELYQYKTKNKILPKIWYIDQIDIDRLPDFFIFKINLEVFFEGDTSEASDTTPPPERDIRYLEDMRDWILTEHPEEIFLKTNDSQIPANKAILCARSPEFRRMFGHPMSEQEINIVHIDGVNGTTLKTLVDFLYSGKLELPETEFQSLKELYYAAHKYKVEDLRKICTQTMLSILTNQNVIGVLLIARQHSNQCLKDKCLRFIRASACIGAIMETNDWIHLKESYPQLAIEVLATHVK